MRHFPKCKTPTRCAPGTCDDALPPRLIFNFVADESLPSPSCTAPGPGIDHLSGWAAVTSLTLKTPGPVRERPEKGQDEGQTSNFPVLASSLPGFLRGPNRFGAF